MREYPINKPEGIEVKGVKSGTFTLTEREYESLLKRFDPDNYFYGEVDNTWYVAWGCILCAKAYRKQSNQDGEECPCDFCPLGQFETDKANGCLVLLFNISGQETILKFHATQKGTKPVRMLKALRKIQAFLQSGKKVR